jgi:hypothetical protein
MLHGHLNIRSRIHEADFEHAIRMPITPGRVLDDAFKPRDFHQRRLLQLSSGYVSPNSAKRARHRCLDSASIIRVSREYAPYFQLALRLRPSPSGVRGPVLRPSCSRQRPFFMAGHWQRVARRVFAPHL